MASSTGPETPSILKNSQLSNGSNGGGVDSIRVVQIADQNLDDANQQSDADVPEPSAFRKGCQRFTPMLAFSLYLAYFLYATFRCLDESCKDDGWWTLLTLSCIVFGVILLYFFLTFAWPKIYKSINQNGCISNFELGRLKFVVWSLLIAGYLGFVIGDAVSRDDPQSLISLGGVVAILCLCTLGSKYKRAIRLRPVINGLIIQFLLAVFVLRIPIGNFIFDWMGQKVAAFLEHAGAGAAFVWRSAFASGDFAFTVLPIIPFFAAVTSILFYLGWIQAVIKVMTTIMEKIMGTTGGESTSCSANIFLGMTEAPLLIRPFMRHMTESEIHAVMTGGFATIAGSVMGAFIALGVNPTNLLTASVMAAPAALALSKLTYPETKITRMSSAFMPQLIEEEKRNTQQPRDIVEAACEGASMSIPLVANIAANLIAVIALLSFINSMFAWFGERVGLAPPLIDAPFTLEFIFSYVLWPIAYLMGVPADDCRAVARLLGLKIVLNEFVAYDQMGGMIKSRGAYTAYYCDYLKLNSTELAPVLLSNGSYYLPATNETLIPFMSQRAESIATYALCGFSNLAAIGIQIGGLGALVPEMKPVITKVAVRAMLTGTAVNWLNAATAGLLLPYKDQSDWTEICAKVK